jgi:hypothetical protein
LYYRHSVVHYCLAPLQIYCIASLLLSLPLLLLKKFSLSQKFIPYSSLTSHHSYSPTFITSPLHDPPRPSTTLHDASNPTEPTATLYQKSILILIHVSHHCPCYRFHLNLPCYSFTLSSCRRYILKRGARFPFLGLERGYRVESA